MTNLILNRKKYWSSIWNRYWPLFIVYIVMIILWLWLNFFCVHLEKSDVKSWFISFSDDIIFFGIGLVTAVLGSRLPEEEAFERRVHSLANGRYANKDAEIFLKDEVERLMSFNKQFRINFIIQKFSSDENFLYILTESEGSIANMGRDDDINLSTIGFVKPTIDSDGLLGYVTYHSVKREGYEEYYFIKPGHRIDLKKQKDNEYSVKKRLPIQGNSLTQIRLCYELWAPIGADEKMSDNWHFHSFTNYAETCEINIVNNLENTDIVFKYKYKDRNEYLLHDSITDTIRDGIIHATKGETIIPGLKFKKGDRFEIFFTTRQVAT